MYAPTHEKLGGPLAVRVLAVEPLNLSESDLEIYKLNRVEYLLMYHILF